ncbi:MAG: hypothetical protein JO165_09595 [Candidatus Eremiobacteraeota bacterium]|nr:hypothetical protein [Candidatus Eremiobacteraeota bacterium]
MRSRLQLSASVCAVLALAAGCSGTHNASFTPPTQQQSAFSRADVPAATPTPLKLAPGKIVGLDDQFTPTDGNSSSGGQGQPVDGLTCNKTMSENHYHVHWYLGLLVNGTQIAIPDGVGMQNPGADGTYFGYSNFTNTATCFYDLHTHDASGMIHTESPLTIPFSSSAFTLGTLLDVWGISISSSNFGPYIGPVQVYTAKVPLKTLTASNYTLYTGADPTSIAVYSHMAIWIEVGPTFVSPPNIPAIKFYTEY